MRSVWPCQAATTSAAMPAARIREMLLCRSLPSVIASSPAAVRWAANSREYSRTGSHVSEPHRVAVGSVALSVPVGPSPVQVIEDQFVARMDPQAPARLYERSLGALDATAGKMLGDPELEKRGAAL